MYDKNDYKVIDTYIDAHFGILMSAKLLIKGAEFSIRRVMANNHTFHGSPTKIFEFDSINSFVDGDYHNEMISVDWNIAVAGMVKIGRELGLDFQMGSSLFSNGHSKPHFIEVA